MVPHAWGFLDHTQRSTTVGRTPLDEWSVRRRDLYLTTQNTHNRQTSVLPGGIGTHDPSRRAAVDLRLSPRGHWDRLIRITRDFVLSGGNTETFGSDWNDWQVKMRGIWGGSGGSVAEDSRLLVCRRVWLWKLKMPHVYRWQLPHVVQSGGQLHRRRYGMLGWNLWRSYRRRNVTSSRYLVVRVHKGPFSDDFLRCCLSVFWVFLEETQGNEIDFGLYLV